MSTLIIAEAGVNHNGDMGLARELIDAAASAGADIVKFQTFSADRLVVPGARKAPYQQNASHPDESQDEMLRRLELTPARHEELIEHCRRRAIEFLSTPFDIESVALLVALGVKRLKVPSGELTNLPYLRCVAACGKPVILSTGMATMAEVGQAVAALEGAGLQRSSLTVLHCTSAYPTAMSQVNLRAMSAMRDALGVDVGYSDHTIGIEVATAAAAMGAAVIEKHLTVSRDLPGPDHRASMEPEELGRLVQAVRNIEAALGDGIKRPTAAEATVAAVARKSIVAARPIAVGEIFSEANLTVKRPGTGVSPMHWDTVLGQPARRDFRIHELIEL